MRGALPLVGLIALVGAVGVPARVVSAESSVDSTVIRPATLTPQLDGARRIGSVDPAERVAFDVVLPLQHSQDLASLLQGLYDPSSPRYQRWLTPDEFSRRFGPASAQVDAVVSWLHDVGLSDTQLVNGRVEVRTTVRVASKALGISLSQYRLADGEDTFSMQQAPEVPRAIVGDIASIVGLSDTPRFRSHLEIAPGTRAPPSELPHASTCATSVQEQANGRGGWTTAQVAARYQVNGLWNAGLTGAGQTIAVFELAPHIASDTSASHLFRSA